MSTPTARTQADPNAELRSQLDAIHEFVAAGTRITAHLPDESGRRSFVERASSAGEMAKTLNVDMPEFRAAVEAFARACRNPLLERARVAELF